MKPGWESWPRSCQCELFAWVCTWMWVRNVYSSFGMFQAAGADFASPLLESQCMAVWISNRPTRSRSLSGQLNWNVFPDSAVFSRTPPRFATTPQCGTVAWSYTTIKLSGDALGSTRIDAIDEQPCHCLEKQTRAMHYSQSRACSSRALTCADWLTLMRAHDSTHCKKILAPVTRYGRETRY